MFYKLINRYFPAMLWGRGRKKTVMSKTVIFLQIIKLLDYLTAPMLTSLLLNYNVELIMIYSRLCSSFMKIPGCPVKMQMFL